MLVPVLGRPTGVTVYKRETYRFEFWRAGVVHAVIHQQGEPLLDERAPESVRSKARTSRDARRCDLVRVLVGENEVFAEQRADQRFRA